MKKKIPLYLEGEILERSAKNESGDEIALWLGQQHGIDVSGRRVRAWLEQRRLEREPIAKAAIARAVAEHVSKDMYALQDLVEEAQRQYRKANRSKDIRAALRALQVEAAVRELRLKLSGAKVDPAGNTGTPGQPKGPQKVIFFPVEAKTPAAAAPAPPDSEPKKK